MVFQGGVDAVLLTVPELRTSELHLAEPRHRSVTGAVRPQPWLCGGLEGDGEKTLWKGGTPENPEKTSLSEGCQNVQW